MSYFDSVWDSRVWAWTIGTIGVIVFGVAVILFRVAPKDSLSALRWGGLIVLPLLVALAFAPRGYGIDGSTLRVRLVAAAFTYDLKQLSEASLVDVRDAFGAGTWRVFGVGGLFGYYGYFKSPKLGKFLAFVTARDELVLLRFGNKVLVLSPHNARDFLQQVQAASKATHFF